MANRLMHKCTACQAYTLQEACPQCGARAVPPQPAKYSPEDHYGDYRRKLKKLDADKAAAPRQSNGGT